MGMLLDSVHIPQFQRKILAHPDWGPIFCLIIPSPPPAPPDLDLHPWLGQIRELNPTLYKFSYVVQVVIRQSDAKEITAWSLDDLTNLATKTT
jgi:hypothetical protein